MAAAAPKEDPYEENWTESFDQGELKAIGSGVAVDDSGNAYVIGRYQKRVLDETIWLSYIMCYDSEGKVAWRQDQQTNSRYSDITVSDVNKRVYCIAQLGNHCRIRISTLSGGSRWSDHYLSNAVAKGLTLDQQGNIFITGRGSGDFFDDYEKGSGSSFLIKYRQNGEVAWKRRIGYDTPIGNGFGNTEKIASDSEGNTFVTGTAFSDFVGTNLSPKTEDDPSGKPDIFLIKFDPAGAIRWARQFGTINYDTVRNLTVDESGNIYVIGYTDKREVGNASIDELIVKYDNNGTQKWMAINSTGKREYGYSIAAGPTGAIYTSGVTIDPNTNETSTNLFKYDPKTGKERWNIFTQSNPGNNPTSIAVGPISEGTVADAVFLQRNTTVESSPGVFGPGALAELTRYSSPDSDGDGLLDDWETVGVPYTDSAGVYQYLVLPNADPYHKNLYVEFDSMPGTNLSNSAIQDLEAAFATAPLTNPDGTTGIILTIEKDESDFTNIPSWQLTGEFLSGFDGYRTQFFGTKQDRAEPNRVAAKAYAYRYGVFAHASTPNSIGGIAQISGDNFVLFDNNVNQQGHAPVFMHEFGHCLGLRHGGSDNINGKTNYPSIMNYVLSYQYTWNASFWEMDYSRADASTLTTVNESSIQESDGVSSEEGYYKDYHMPFGVVSDNLGNRSVKYVQLNGSPTDFSDEFGTQTQDGIISDGTEQDLNYVSTRDESKLSVYSSPGQTFTPHDDWGNITLKLKATKTGEAANAISDIPVELTVEARDWIENNFPIPPGSNYAPSIEGPGSQALEANTATAALEITIGDNEDEPAELILTAFSDNQEVVDDAGITLSGSGSNRIVVINPVQDSTGGVATITLRVTDLGERSAETHFAVEVTAFEDFPPLISIPTNGTVFKNATSIPFDFSISDIEDSPTDLVVTASSSSQALIPDENITLDGFGSNRSITVATTEAFNDFVNITLTVADSNNQTTDATLRLFVQDNYIPQLYTPNSQTIQQNALSSAIPFTAFDNNEETKKLTFLATSDNQELISDDNLSFETHDHNHSLLVTPTPGKAGGPVTITLTISDNGGLVTETTLQVWVDSTVSNPWLQTTPLTHMPTPRQNFATIVVDKKIYAIGGTSRFTYIDTVEEYDPISDTWTTKKEMPTARQDAAVAEVDGFIHVLGGQLHNYEDNITSAHERYDPQTDTWSSQANTPTPREGAAAATLTGKIYLFGGKNYSEGTLARIDVYDPSTNTWERKQDMPFSDQNLKVSVIENRAYILGGISNPSSIWEYEPESETWTQKANLPTPRARLSTTTLEGKIYTIGGLRNPSAKIEIYDPSTDTWSVGPSMPTARGGLGAATVSGSIYAIGGRATYENYTDIPSLSLVEKLSFASLDIPKAILSFRIHNPEQKESGSQFTLIWEEPDSDYVIESSATLKDDWENVPKDSATGEPTEKHLTIKLESNPQFFRIRLAE